MKRNIIKLKQGSVKIEKEVVSSTNFSKREREIRSKLLNEALGLGFSITLPIVGGALLGVALDSHFNTAPKLLLGLLFLGTIISIIRLFRLAKTDKNN